ncbi:Uncharacterized protein FWK35_00019247, partial [Aphis craccivora]
NCGKFKNLALGLLTVNFLRRYMINHPTSMIDNNKYSIFTYYLLIDVLVKYILDSERSDECVDFTMLCVFFVSVYTRTCRNNTSISNLGCGFRYQKELSFSNFPIVFKSAEKNQKKIKEKWEFFTENQFSTKSISLYDCNSKTNHCKYLKFSPNFYLKILENFTMSITFFWPDQTFENLNSGIFRPLKHKPPFSPTIRNYILG